MVVTLRSRAVRDANDNTTKEEVLKIKLTETKRKEVLQLIFNFECFSLSGLQCCWADQRCAKRSNHTGCFHWSAYRSLGWEKSANSLIEWSIFSFHPDPAPLPCSDWSLQGKWFQWSVCIFGDEGTIFGDQANTIKWTKVDGFRGMVGAPAQFNTVLFGGFLGSVFSFLQVINVSLFSDNLISISPVSCQSNHWRPQWSLWKKTLAAPVNYW